MCKHRIDGRYFYECNFIECKYNRSGICNNSEALEPLSDIVTETLQSDACPICGKLLTVKVSESESLNGLLEQRITKKCICGNEVFARRRQVLGQICANAFSSGYVGGGLSWTGWELEDAQR